MLPADPRHAPFWMERAACRTIAIRTLDVTRRVAYLHFDGSKARPLALEPEARRTTERLYGLLLAGDAIGGAERTALLAEASVASEAVSILHDLLQLTGAIGFTWEHGLHFFERRAHLDAMLARNPRSALCALADLEAW